MKILYILRGIPGSGKSTLARQLVGRANVIEIDDYFYGSDGKYHFDRQKIPAAVEESHARLRRAMIEERPLLAVANTHVTKKEYQPYVKLAEEYGYEVIELIVRSGFKDVHDVPEDRIRDMEQRFEY